MAIDNAPTSSSVPEPRDQMQSMTQRLSGQVDTARQIMREAGAPGVSFAVIYRGQTVSTEHLGYRNVESKEPLDSDTRGTIASLTKAIVAALVGIEVSRGTLSWDTRIIDVLPEFRSADQLVQEHATILDFLSFRTGVSIGASRWEQGENCAMSPPESTLPAYAARKRSKAFRDSFLYDNHAYELIGQVLERVKGVPIGEQLRTEIFEPLGMHRTSTSWDEPTEDGNSTTAHVTLSDGSLAQIIRTQVGKGTLMEAAGGIKSSLADMTLYCKALLQAIKHQHAHRSDSTPDNPLKQVRTLIDHHAKPIPQSLHEEAYGAGWMRIQLPGRVGRQSQNSFLADVPITGHESRSTLVVAHHGSHPGATCFLALIPDIEAGVMVMSNGTSLCDVSSLVGQLLIETLLETPKSNDYVALARDFRHKTLQFMPNISSTLASTRQADTLSRPIQDYVGTYWTSAHDFCVRISEEDGKLWLRFQNQTEAPYAMRHHAHDSWEWNMSYDEAAKRARLINFFGAKYYVLHFFSGEKTGPISGLRWAWYEALPDEMEEFRRED